MLIDLGMTTYFNTVEKKIRDASSLLMNITKSFSMFTVVCLPIVAVCAFMSINISIPYNFDPDNIIGYGPFGVVTAVVIFFCIMIALFMKLMKWF